MKKYLIIYDFNDHFIVNANSAKEAIKLLSEYTSDSKYFLFQKSFDVMETVEEAVLCFDHFSQWNIQAVIEISDMPYIDNSAIVIHNEETSKS